MWQGRKPSGDAAAVDPCGLRERLAFAERGVEAPVAELDASRDAGQCHVALDGGELE